MVVCVLEKWSAIGEFVSLLDADDVVSSDMEPRSCWLNVSCCHLMRSIPTFAKLAVCSVTTGELSIAVPRLMTRWCPKCKSGKGVVNITIPYAAKLLLQELMGMNIMPKLCLEVSYLFPERLDSADIVQDTV